MPPAIYGHSNYYDKKTLILSPFAGKTANSIRVAIPHLGKCLYKKDAEFNCVDDFEIFIDENNIGRVLFFNCYGNEQRLELYNRCLEKGIKTINFDRGGLPDTWFFDPSGFNYSSESYSPKKWEKKLDSEQKDEIQQYIQNTLLSDETLEKNGERIGAVNFAKKYNIENRKVIFVPLQRPNDTVIKYFSDKIKSVENFINDIKCLAEGIKDKGWSIIIKQHPLEEHVDITGFDNIITLNSNAHFCDAIMCSDAVMLINSGVGLYSLMANKPTYNVGDAFYSHKGLSNKISSPLELIEKLDKLNTPQLDKVESFIYYLINDFYSIGKTTYRIQFDSKTKSSTTNAIFTDFSIIRLPLDNGSFKEIKIERRLEPHKITSSYYDYYRSAIVMRGKSTPESTPVKQPGKKNIKSSSTTPVEVKKLPIDENPNESNKIIEINPQIKNKSNLKRKVNKLVKNPMAFFGDAVKKRKKITLPQ
jgi:hypothetical protein